MLARLHHYRLLFRTPKTGQLVMVLGISPPPLPTQADTDVTSVRNAPCLLLLLLHTANDQPLLCWLLQ